ncbi:23586_t:CDS:2, partial [Racocetra persica]
SDIFQNIKHINGISVFISQGYSPILISEDATKKLKTIKELLELNIRVLALIFNSVKCPLNAFILYQKEKIKDNPNMNTRQISKIARNKWNKLPESKKARYKLQSESLKGHYNTIKKYNTPYSDLDTIPASSLQEFKDILIQQIHHHLPLSFTRMGRKVLSIPCTESLFVGIFAGHIYQFSSSPRTYKCRFHGESAYSTLTKILENSKWGQKYYNQNQQTYIVFEQLSKQTSSNTNITENQDDINLLEHLILKTDEVTEWAELPENLNETDENVPAFAQGLDDIIIVKVACGSI